MSPTIKRNHSSRRTLTSCSKLLGRYSTIVTAVVIGYSLHSLAYPKHTHLILSHNHHAAGAFNREVCKFEHYPHVCRTPEHSNSAEHSPHPRSLVNLHRHTSNPLSSPVHPSRRVFGSVGGRVPCARCARVTAVACGTCALALEQISKLNPRLICVVPGFYIYRNK